jgi:hypothetical protein
MMETVTPAPEPRFPCIRLLKFAILLSVSSAMGQSWKQILPAGNAIDWTTAGVGGIPARNEICARIKPPSRVEAINFALASCRDGQTVLLGAGTYNVNGTIQIPSNVTLRGAGASLTILKATGKAGGDVISLGSGSVGYAPLGILSGAIAGSTQIELTNASTVKAGMFIAIAEVNNPGIATSAGTDGNCNWCDGWTDTGELSRGQIVEVTGVTGNKVSFSPALYSAYTNLPGAVPFRMSAQYAGVEDLQVYATNSGYASNFGLHMCAHCWVRRVESNYTDGDHVEIYWGFHDEIRDSYFSNAFLHRPGEHDSDLQIGFKTSASLVENNIIERTHAAIMLEWGAAGNVVAYNYTTGEFDSGATNVVIGGIDFHGAHPQFNLLEGNVVTKIYEDPFWGSASQTTAFRNSVVGTNRICSPMNGRADVSCAGPDGHYGFQAARAIDLSYLSKADNYVANVVGSAQMQALMGYNAPLTQSASVEYPAPRNYDAVAYEWSFGYGSTGDDGSNSGCGSGTPACHCSGIAATDFIHGNYSNLTRSVAWVPDRPQQLPASFYLSAMPKWWSKIPFPAIGPDVSGGFGPGGHSYGNPAQVCYVQIMHGVDGGERSPLFFNPDQCYGTVSPTAKTQ